MDTTTAQIPKDRRISLPYSFPTSLHDRLEAEGNEKHGGNRSARAEELVLKGLEAERAQPASRKTA